MLRETKTFYLPSELPNQQILITGGMFMKKNNGGTANSSISGNSGACAVSAKRIELLSRIGNNHYNFIRSLSGVSRTKLISMAGRIAVVTEACEMLTRDYGWEDENEIDFLLLFRDPLAIIADAWEDYKNEKLIDFENAMFDVTCYDAAISEYPLVEGIDINLYGNVIYVCDCNNA